MKQYQIGGCNGGKYRMVYFYDGKVKRQFYVHRLVAEAFIDNPNNKPCVNHIDGNPGNNSVTNLEWVTSSENLIHAYTNLVPKYKCRFCGSVSFTKLRICKSCRGKLFDVNQTAIDNVVRLEEIQNKLQRKDILQLSEMQKELIIFKLIGIPCEEVAKKYGVSRQAISERLKKLLS
ncbi:hypothetical protein DS742_19370 [Lacrimispora amygdalina]|uniref:HNH nuclease domain-containing protein n=1 Tax=Lacrimispora amygdalina TaxID=253257 RepID=A0A3E2N8L1_9FIRM|nr:HNH endonuclease signature motif containing protein [Clostridium indicum]RFZ77349.1 hypothetical protein DS742_19370 [Clostridium indicum]